MSGGSELEKSFILDIKSQELPARSIKRAEAIYPIMQQWYANDLSIIPFGSNQIQSRHNSSIQNLENRNKSQYMNKS